MQLKQAKKILSYFNPNDIANQKWELFKKARKPKAYFVHFFLVYLNHILWSDNWMSGVPVLIDELLLF